MELSGNKILITGATSGIGLALLEEFLALDNQILAVGRNQEKLAALAQKDARIFTFSCDLGQVASMDNLLVWIEQEHTDLNILINNAGMQYNYHFLEALQLSAKINQEIEVNFKAPLQLIGHLLPILTSNRNAAVVNVSSGLGLVPKMAAPVYCATKAGLHIFSQALRDQLIGEVKVFEIIPPLVDTAMTKGRGKGKISPEQLVQEFLKAFKRDQLEVPIGKVKLLTLIQRISPRLARRIMRGQ
ncbi:MAG: SDR family oxidoreductase [Aureispira sp.]